MRTIYYNLIIILFVGCCTNYLSAQSKQLAVPSMTTQQLENGLLKQIDSFPSKYVTPRNVDIWLPEYYDATLKYAVLYMHDGQRLFTGESDKKGREMMVDETASILMSDNKIKDIIVVGIHSIGKERHSNYFPQKPFESLPKKRTDSLTLIAQSMGMNVTISSDNYLKFIIEELKTYVDAQFSTKTDAQNTFIAGASMGGLVSMYAVCEYPEVFGGAACLSAHWPGFMPSEGNPIPQAFFEYMKTHLPSSKTHKFYFDFGTEGMDRFYGEFEDDVNALFKANGYTKESFLNLKIVGGNHSEEFWSKRFDTPLLFLLKK